MPTLLLFRAIPAALADNATLPLGDQCRARFRAHYQHRAERFGTSALVCAMLVAATLPLSIGSASAASFVFTANNTTAQTLGSSSGETGLVTAGTSLAVSSSKVAVTITGNNATLTNLGSINQSGGGRAIRDNTGVSNLVVNNGSSSNASALIQTSDADVIQMAVAAASVTLNNYGSMISLNASAGGAQAVDFNAVTGANVVNNYQGGLLKAFEADAVRPGVNGVVNNAGTILSVTSSGSSSDGVDAQSNSGIVINNAATGVITGARHGITGGQAGTAAFTLKVTNLAGGTIQGMNGSGMNIDGVNSLEMVTVINAGAIIGNGVTGDGDGVDVDGLVNIVNSGIIRSSNAYSAPGSGLAYSEGISVGGGSIVNSGTIEGLVAAGNSNAVGRGITLVGNDIAGATDGSREGIYGTTVVTNQAGGLIRGQADSAIVAQGPASNGYTIVINNQAGARIVGGGSAAAILVAHNGTTVNNAGTIDGSSGGKAIELGSGNNSVNITGGSAVVNGSINGGVGGVNSMTVNPGAGNSFSYAGAISNFGTVNYQGGNVTLSGQNSYTGTSVISGGTLTLDGANRLAAGSALELGGGTLRLVNAGGANGQTFASLSLTQNSAVDLGFSSITFNGLGNIASGKTLSFTEYSAAASAYAFRLLGDYSSNADFLALVNATSIDGVKATFSFSNGYTNVTAVPEPASYAMLLAGLALMGAVVRRRKQRA